MKNIHYKENVIINTAYFEPSLIPDIASKITGAEFDSPTARELFDFLVMASSNQQTDQQIKAAVIGFDQYEAHLRSINSVGMDRHNYGVICSDLREAANLRRIKDICQQVNFDATLSLADTVSKLSEAIAATATSQSGVSRTVGQILKEEAAESLFTMPSESEGMKCSLHAMNEYFVAKGNKLIILAARASIGKTALAMRMASDYRQQGARGLFFSLEMTGGELVQRLSAIETGINLERIGNITCPDDFERMGEFVNSRRNSDLIIYEKFSPLMAEIRIEAIKRHGEKPLDYIVIDYLQLIKAKGGHGSREQEVAAMAGACKALSKELDVPVIVLAQLNRMAEGEFPKLNHLRESGALEQDADIILLLHRDRAAQAARNDPSNTNFDPLQTAVSIAKNRGGKIGIATIGFIPERADFVEMEKHF